jgi:hypothetical protein
MNRGFVYDTVYRMDFARGLQGISMNSNLRESEKLQRGTLPYIERPRFLKFGPQPPFPEGTLDDPTAYVHIY